VNPDQRPRRLFCLALGTGVGACVLDEGRLLRSNGNSSGHFGQIDVTVIESGAMPPVGADGGVGTLEAYWAAAAVGLRHASTHDKLDAVLLETLARALRIAHAIYRPDAIVLAGGTSLHLRQHAKAITVAMQKGLSSIARPQCGIHFAAHAHHAALGIARLAAGDAAAEHPHHNASLPCQRK
jgi:predicted NBD/HSP70 family sugar kinase